MEMTTKTRNETNNSLHLYCHACSVNDELMLTYNRTITATQQCKTWHAKDTPVETSMSTNPITNITSFKTFYIPGIKLQNVTYMHYYQ